MGYIIGCIDLETLGLFDDSIILSMGVCTWDITVPIDFKQLTDEGLFLKFNSVEQMRIGRKTTQSTVEWWKEQPEEAKEISFYPKQTDISIKSMSTHIINWFEQKGLKHDDIDMWTRVQGFERFKIQHVCETLGLTELFDRKRYFDVPTLAHCTMQDRYAGIYADKFEGEGFVYHHPVHDAALDIIRIQKLMSDANMIEIQAF